MISNPNNINLETISNEFNLKKTVLIYLKQWKWFALSCMLSIGLAFLYLMYTPPEYNAYAQIIIVDDGSASAPGIDILKDLRRFSESDGKKTEDEIEALKSRQVLKSVIKKLSLNIAYSEKGSIHETPLYPDSPIKINFTASDSIVDHSKYGFSLNIISDTAFNFEEEDNEQDNTVNTYDFGKSILTPLGNIIIIPNTINMAELIGQTIYVKITPVDELAEYYKNKVLIKPITEYSNVINLSLNDEVLERGKKILNTLIDEYNRISIEEKNQKSKNAANFINERIDLISTDLSRVDDKIERFKTGHRLTDITSEAELYLNSSSQSEQDIAVAKTQLNLINYMKDYVDDDSLSFEAIPSNVGLSDPSINNISSKYNDLLRERNGLLKGSTKEKNPIIVNLDQQLEGLKQSLVQSLSNSAKTLSFQLKSLENRSSAINSKIYQVPGQVRESRDIEREQGIKESLYLYLLQKREEATISLTSTSPNARIIDEAYSLGLPVFPKKNIVFLAAVLVGFFIPFSVIYVSELLDTKIHNKEDLEKYINGITVLGEIPKLREKELNSYVKRNDRSLLAESFRIIRTNLDYVRRGRDVKAYNNVIFVTSTINGEGKSFFSMNMALTLTNNDKRVLLIGADIRNPKSYSVLKDYKSEKTSKFGLTEFLVDKSVVLENAISTHRIDGNKIDVLLSGKIPPNPAELLMSDRMKPLFDEVSNRYDFVIVDTAPSMLVTDTLLISQFAGHTIFLTRAGYTEKNLLNFAKDLYVNNKLNGMMLVVNCVNDSNFGYGNKYTYYEGKKQKSYFSRF